MKYTLLGGSGGMPPPEIFGKIATLRLNLVGFGQLHVVDCTQVPNHALILPCNLTS